MSKRSALLMHEPNCGSETEVGQHLAADCAPVYLPWLASASPETYPVSIRHYIGKVDVMQGLIGCIDPALR